MGLAGKRSASREEGAEKGWGGPELPVPPTDTRRGRGTTAVHSHRSRVWTFGRVIDVTQNSKHFGFEVPSADRHSMMQ